MSDTMLLGVLRMSFENAMSTLIERIQYHQRGVQAADEIEKLRAENELLRASLSWYADQRNHLPVERRNPGDPDPAVIILDEPPILLDGGTLARIALEGKP